MADIREIFEMATKQAEPDLDSWKQQERIQIRRRRSKKLGAFAVAAAIALIALVVVVVANREASESLPADDTAPPAPVESDQFIYDLDTGVKTPLPEGIAGDNHYMFDVSPDGTMVTFEQDPDVNSKIVVANFDGSDPHEFSIDGMELRWPKWSPDGATIVFMGGKETSRGPGNLYVADVVTGNTTRITSLPQDIPPPGAFLAPDFSPDGERVLFQFPNRTSGMRHLWSVPSTGGEPTLVRKGAAFGELSPDGSQIAFLPTTEFDPWTATSIELVDAADRGTPRTLVEGSYIRWHQWSPDGRRISYSDSGFSEIEGVYVVDVGTGETTESLGDGYGAWVDDHTLIVSPLR